MNPTLRGFPPVRAEAAILTRMRRLLLGTFGIGALGAGTELLLIGHFEDRPQIVPLALVAGGLTAAAWVAWRPSPAALRTFQVLMLGFIVGGAVGVGLHYQGNQDFELEMYPDLAGLDLVTETLTGALPVLAPGTMTVLGLVGLTATYRHPRSNHFSSEA